MKPPRRGFWLRLIASATLLSVCLVLIDPSTLVEALHETPIAYFLLALVLNAIGTIAIKAWIAYLVTRASGLDLSFPKLVKINLVARFYTLVLPRGASAAVRWHHYRQGGTGHAAAALLLFENLVSIATLFASAAIILSLEHGSAGRIGSILLPIALLGTLASVLALLPFLHERSAKLADRLLAPVVRKKGRVPAVIGRTMDSVRTYQKVEFNAVWAVFLASLLGYILFVMSAWVLAKGMELEIGLLPIAWIRSATLLLALVPVTVAGLGLREASFIALLGGYGIAPTHAFAFAMTSFAIQVALGVLGATLELSRILKQWSTRKSNSEEQS